MAQGLVVNHVWNVGPVPSENDYNNNFKFINFGRKENNMEGKVALLSIMIQYLQTVIKNSVKVLLILIQIYQCVKLQIIWFL